MSTPEKDHELLDKFSSQPTPSATPYMFLGITFLFVLIAFAFSLVNSKGLEDLNVFLLVFSAYFYAITAIFFLRIKVLDPLVRESRRMRQELDELRLRAGDKR